MNIVGLLMFEYNDHPVHCLKKKYNSLTFIDSYQQWTVPLFQGDYTTDERKWTRLKRAVKKEIEVIA